MCIFKQHLAFQWWILQAALLVVIAIIVGGGVVTAADPVHGTKQQKLLELNENNWEFMLKGEWMVEFFAPWCPDCKNLAPTWERFASVASQFNVNVAKIDVTTSPSLRGRFFVTALPTIYHVVNGEFRQYRNPCDFDAFVMFVKTKQWKTVEPLPYWKNPTTIHMSVISYSSKLAHMLKDFNSRLQQEYGLPTWGSYALSAIGTIFVGAALGLLLVCIAYFLYPQKRTHRQNFNEARRRVNDDFIEDLVNDELEDDAERDDDGAEGEVDDDDEVEQEEERKDGEKGEEDSNDDDANADDDEQDQAGDSSENEKNRSEAEQEVDENKGQEKTAGGKGPNAKVVVPGHKGEEEVPAAPAAASSGGDVRKRKPRKAD